MTESVTLFIKPQLCERKGQLLCLLPGLSEVLALLEMNWQQACKKNFLLSVRLLYYSLIVS